MQANWKNSTIYQIYPKSFKDSNGDGIGDIPGIIEKIPYLKNLGVDYLWLTPMYKSPQNDNGYDISDYYSIDPVYGTMEDFKQLLTALHHDKMKLMMDIVVNHTSTEHHWFKQAQQSKTNPYRDYYIWKDAINGKEPTNWQSKFGGSAWEYSKQTDQYYLHLFDKTQADLNWENPKLRKEIYQMMKWWLSLGVDAFRLDVVNLLSKNQQFPNDTLQTAQEDGRKYYTDGPKIHQYLNEMNTEVFSKYKNTITVGEMSSTTIEHCAKYTNPESKELDMTFNFHHLKVDYENGEKWSNAPVDVNQFKKILTEWQQGMQVANGWNALFLTNHDQPRAISRFTNPQDLHYEAATMLATMIIGMRGTPYIFQGEEIGMLNPNFTKITQYRDIESHNNYQILLDKGHTEQQAIEILQLKSRDNARTPMQWSKTANSGFTEGTPWIEIAKSYEQINVQTDSTSAKSIYSYYQKIIHLRKAENLLINGNFTAHPTTAESFVYYRTIDGQQQKLLIMQNLTAKTIQTPIQAPNKTSEIILSNYQTASYPKELMPYEAIIIKII
ncbi:MAG: alpha,alpha-phosphotrehalase [Culicoidibacterales bacterium]